MPTGGGKSLCYQLPPLVSESTDVVISPLVALMKDQVDSLEAIGYPAAAIHSGLTAEERARTRDRLAAGELRLLFTAPERLVNTGLLDLLARVGVKRFSIDEAHCISHWGHDFRPEYRQMALLRERFPSASLHAFTATATPRVRDDIVAQLHLRDPDVLLGTFDRPNLVYRVVPRTDRVAQTLQILGRHAGEASIVYCISRKETERLAARLAAEGILARPYHAGLDPEQRRRTQEAFARETIDVVVATVAFGMGIDRSDVRLVLHTSLPKSLEAYQQETGRAGRDGLAAECVLLYSSADVFSWESLVRKSADESSLEPAEAERLVAGQVEHLHAMRRYAQAARCRHAALSEYFGQAYGTEPCGACDVCLGETASIPDSTVVAQKIISCVARAGERFGVRHVCEVLRGARTEGISRHGHDRLSTFGILSTLDQRAVENLAHQLLDQGLLARSGGDRPVVMLNEQSWEVLRGTRQVVLLEPRAGRTRTAKADADDWKDVDRDLFERLRKWRRRVAESRGKPAWTIFDDKSLRAIAREKPSSPAALLRVKGIGEKRLADFGAAILDLVAGRDTA
jgi:ATP-dependent DNA helicase RecQ